MLNVGLFIGHKLYIQMKFCRVMINAESTNTHTLEALFHTFDGQERVVVLLNLLNKQQKLALPLEQVKKH